MLRALSPRFPDGRYRRSVPWVLEQLQTRLVRQLLWREPTEPNPTVERLRAAVAEGAVLHGTRQGDLERIDARMQSNYFGHPVHGVFATRDPIWPIFYAVVDRTSAGSMRCQCLTGRSGTRYLFSTEGDPRWAAGNVYVLQGDDFEPVAGTGEMVCRTKPYAEVVDAVRVEPADFPFLTRVGRHDQSEPVWRTLWRLRSH